MNPRRTTALGAIAVTAISAIAVTVALRHSTPAQHKTAHAIYAAQPERTAIWDAPPLYQPIPSTKFGYLAHTGSWTFFNPAMPGFNIEQHFVVARRLHALNPKLRIFDYFNATYWYGSNQLGFAPYSSSFQSSWLLRDTSQRLIPFYSVSTARAAQKPTAYLLDLRNPALRRWIVSTLSAWVRAAPYRGGVVLDSADPLSATSSRPQVGDGRSTFGMLLCGLPQSTCPQLIAWNNGLSEMLGQVTQALKAAGDRVLYNGIAPSLERGPSRNLAQLHDTNGAGNESFCIGPSASDPRHVTYQSVIEDAAIMQSAARQHKFIVQTTNYGSASSQSLAEYCAGAFMIGWQPGYSLQIYHRTYSDLDDDHRVVAAESRLALGDPKTFGYAKTGLILSRQFDHGFVAVNTGSTTGSLTAPDSLIQYEGGHRRRAVIAGHQIQLPGHIAMFFLNKSYVES